MFDAETGELLGAHMIGAEVTELIQGYAIARQLETTEAELMHTVFPHPTLSEMMHESVLAAFRTGDSSEMVQTRPFHSRVDLSVGRSGRMAELDREKVWKDFHGLVNMTATEIDNWLRTQSSHAVGWKGCRTEARESVGHASGRHISEILKARKQDLTADDYAAHAQGDRLHQRHSTQRPANVYTSRWRYSLMNWGTTPPRRTHEGYCDNIEQRTVEVRTSAASSTPGTICSWC